MMDIKEAIEQMTDAWNNKDEAAMRPFLHDDYKFKGPMMEANSADECIAMMKDCPFEGGCENHEIIVEGNKAVSVFDWVVTAPFQATIPMIEVMEFEGGKVKNSRMFFDTGLFPAEVMEQMKEQAAA